MVPWPVEINSEGKQIEVTVQGTKGIKLDSNILKFRPKRDQEKNEPRKRIWYTRPREMDDLLRKKGGSWNLCGPGMAQPLIRSGGEDKVLKDGIRIKITTSNRVRRRVVWSHQTRRKKQAHAGWPVFT